MITQQSPSYPSTSNSNLADSSCEEDISFDSIPYDVELVAAIREAQASIRRGDFITFEEFEKEIDSWFSE